MINIPKDLSDIEVGIYKSGYSYCESLVKVKHMAIDFQHLCKLSQFIQVRRAKNLFYLLLVINRHTVWI